MVESAILFGMMIGLVLWATIAYFVSKDASSRNKSGLWGPVVLVFGLFGLGAYGLSFVLD